MKVEENKVVVLDYEGKFDDGTVFDSSEKAGKPLEFVVGAGMVIAGFETAVMGLKVGDEKEFSVEPNEGYGEYNPEMKKEVLRTILPPEQKPEKGMMIVMGTPDGRQFPALITDVDEQKIVIDLNHPLAGKKLNFKIKVKGVKENDNKMCTCHPASEDECKCEEDGSSCDCEEPKKDDKEPSIEDIAEGK